MKAAVGWALLVLVILAATVLVTLVAGAVWDELTDRWRARRRTLPDVLAERLGSEDVYAEDRPRLVAMDFADIAATMPDLAGLDRELAGLYLIPTEEGP